MPIFILKSFIFDPIFAVLYFPVYWYGPGLLKRDKGLGRRVRNLAHFLALRIMFINLFKPMFGEHTRSGRIISFFMRLILLGWRLILFVLGTIFWTILFLAWIFLPLLALRQIIFYFKRI